MLIQEFRIPMPLTVEEYQIGQLYSFGVESMNNTGGGDGLQVVRSEPFSDVPLLNDKPTSGQYTYKIYYMDSKTPNFIKLVMPKGSFEFHEESWNAYPYCKTVITNPKFMKDDFTLVIETMHLPGAPHVHNALGLSAEKLKLRKVIDIDIANDRISPSDYQPELDPTRFKSKKNGRGPLAGSWQSKAEPLMTCYKLVTVEFKWWGLQSRVENSVLNTEQRVFRLFHRQIFCLTDEWYNMTIDDIRQFESKVKEELDKVRIHNGVIKSSIGKHKKNGYESINTRANTRD